VKSEVISIADIEGAERLLGMAYTAAEREQMVGNLKGQIGLAVARRKLLPVETNNSVRGMKIARDDLDQGRFACAVVAHQTNDVARVDGEVDLGQCAYRAEILADALQLQDRGAFLAHLLGRDCTHRRSFRSKTVIS
jgi:hypothetical protein